MKQNMKITILLVVLVLSLFSAYMLFYKDDKKNENIAEYQVVFEATWSAETHPDNFPPDPHFSGLIGAVHNSSVIFWEEGQLASQGIENMAEVGSKDPLNSEIDDAIEKGTTFKKLSGDGIGSSPGSVSLTFEISKNFPLVTLVSMIAPSPDWFVGVSGLNLLENSEWIPKKIVYLYAYDAGTDSGTTYISEDIDTLPPENITRIETSPFLVNGNIPPIGMFIFTLK